MGRMNEKRKVEQQLNAVIIILYDHLRVITKKKEHIGFKGISDLVSV